VLQRRDKATHKHAPAPLSPPHPSLLSYLRDAISPTGTGRGLHFAYHSDLTLSAQRLADALADPATADKAPARRADKAYFWNRTLAKPLLGAFCFGAWDAGGVCTVNGRSSHARMHITLTAIQRPCTAPPDAGADAFVLTMILGSVGQITGVEAKAHGRSVGESFAVGGGWG
jgi:hypothetical protein